jgi:hypothetical protein
VAGGLDKTEQALARTRNRAVLPVLESALRSDCGYIRAAAIRATIRRTDCDSHSQLIGLLSKLDEADIAVLVASHRAMPHHAASALKLAILKGDAAQCRNACVMIRHCRDYNLFPTLLKAAENPRHHHFDVIAATILALATELHDEIAVSTGQDEHAGRDPSFDRHHVLTALERSLVCNAQHPRAEIVDAFLMLAPVDNSTLLRILREPTHACHDQLIATLSSSPRATIMERLVALLRDADAPLAALQVVAARSDPPFVHFLLRELKQPVPLRVLHNMKQLHTVAWLEAGRETLLELDGRAQATAVALAAASDIDGDALRELLKLVLHSGLVEGRRAACQALAMLAGPAVDQMVLAALNDPDGSVQAAAVRQLRQRRLPNALQMLVARLHSPSIDVCEAARSSLAEFNYVRYRAMFDLLDEHAVRTTGLLVRQVDHSAREKLAADLLSPSVTTRLRAIEMTVAMDAVQEVCHELIELARHENLAIRKEAVAALALANGPEVRAALEVAARDSHRSVADAARQGLTRHATNDAADKNLHAATIAEVQ